MLELRKKQFSLLLHVVDELQNTIEDEQRSLAENLEWLRMASEENKCLLDDGHGGSEAMAID
ncbi:hypothetical protein QJS10_CPB11g00115 [Acorus calamus]|uniref:Uncharacterized protein n=1 Tax=Acorus calamus TaxID=4465 RepID=A0AAV9DX28_ACOCL|nr:hypothetical protein QJS10_CPB11g00115 [Acorus calamus]